MAAATKVVPQEDVDGPVHNFVYVEDDHDEAVEMKIQQKADELDRMRQVERDALEAWDKAMTALCRKMGDLKQRQQVENDAAEALEDARKDVARLESELMTMMASSSNSVPVAIAMPKKPGEEEPDLGSRSHDEVSPASTCVVHTLSFA